MLSWRLRGAGLPSFGTKGRPDLVPFPAYTEEDLIARVDACGLCFSDIKLISQGAGHPRIQGRDLARDPVVPGHEVSMTIVGVGDAWKGRFEPGGRFIIQADVFYKGRSMAFGYVIPGGLSQYVVIGREILEGDEGCYLLPLRAETGYAEAALVEPWTCVVASYQIAARADLGKDAVMYFRGSESGQIPLDLSGLESRGISRIYHSGLSGENRDRVERLARDASATIEEGAPREDAVPTDIVSAGTPTRDDCVRLTGLLDADGILGIHTDLPDAVLPFDVGKIHYRRMGVIGSTDGKVLAAYDNNTRQKPVRGGSAWFVGGAGPMGQMHVIRAVCDPDGPSSILVTDRLDGRLNGLERLVTLIADKGGRELSLRFLNSKELEGDGLDAYMAREYPGGFDDIVMLVPLAAAISEASAFLAPGGVLNIFAGVQIGTMADLPLEAVVRRRVRVMGSSGSPLSAMKDTLALVESGRLSTALSLAAIGDIFSAGKGMKALMDGTYTGKIVVFPFAEGVGLKSLTELARESPGIAALLLDGRYWTASAEAAMREKLLPARGVLRRIIRS